MSTPSDFERRMRPFIALQAALGASIGFSGVFVHAQSGAAGVTRYAALMLAAASCSMVLTYACGMRWRFSAQRVMQAGFALPAALLWWADGRPDLLGLAFGGFLGLTWGARHWLELHLLANEDRDSYASHAISLAVAVGLVTTLATSVLLALTSEARTPVYALFAALGAAGAWKAGQRLPASPPVTLHAPWQVLSQREYRACLPLFFLESGLAGVAMMLNASGAVRSLGSASHYGWAASAATLAGALALRAARRRRHSENRIGWMRHACVGVVAAAALLGASATWPALFVLHLLLQSAVGPFWMASEHVLNQRAMDIGGALGDRIIAREAALGLFRVMVLGVFWWATRSLDDRQRLVIGATWLGLAAILEYRLGRRWLASAANEGSGVS